ncbi:hypothetical protein, partial [Escherichia coli]|uniref:hypothetical protein n=17 Tax=Enterobacterales TaxID=91347 RepID=UPI00288B01F1
MVNSERQCGGGMISIINCTAESCGIGYSIDSSADVYMSGNEAINCGVGLHINDREIRQAQKAKLPDGHFNMSIVAYLVRVYLQRLRMNVHSRR